MIRDLNILVVYEDIGGYRGRTVVFDCESAELTVTNLRRIDTLESNRPAASPRPWPLRESSEHEVGT